MILDRIIGLIATAAFVLGIVVQVELLGQALQPDAFDPLLISYAALALTAIGYVTLRAERKHGLIDPYDDSIDTIEVAYSLPGWARAVSFILVCYIALLYIFVSNVAEMRMLTWLPEDLSVLRMSLPANGFAALVAALFVFSSFVIAIYLLARKPIKEFH